jgi:hypothetical protein
VGASLLAIFRVKQTLLNAANRWQASSYKSQTHGSVFSCSQALNAFT